MPRLASDTTASYSEPDAVGPVAQIDLSKTKTPGATLAAGITYDSGVIYANGFKAIAAAVKMSQAGTLTLTRYVDEAGLLPQGAAATQAVSANTAAVLNVADNLPFAAFRLTLANTASGAATITAYALLLNAA